MSQKCQLTGKKAASGNNVSHSKRHTKRKFGPNLQTKTFFIPELKRKIRLTVSTRAIRTIAKKGLYNYILEVQRKGVKVL